MTYGFATGQVVLSGCSGGGKSTLLAELARRGFAIVPEPGRRIVSEELRGDGSALPWIDAAAFARKAVEMARRDRLSLDQAVGWVFFDRGLIDAALALEHATGESARAVLERDERYHHQVFLTPPWPEIYATDAERRHGLDEAEAEYGRLLEAFNAYGYQTIVLPKVSVRERADLVLQYLDRGGPDERSGAAR